MAVSLRVPDLVKKRIDRLAKDTDQSAHAFMVAAILEKVEAEEARAAFLSEARRRLARMKKSGRGIPADEAFEYLTAKAAGGSPVRPKARKLP